MRVRKDLGAETIREVHRLLKESIEYGLEHREPTRCTTRCGLAAVWTTRQADQFVGMYVNDWTLDFGPRGREAVARVPGRGPQGRRDAGAGGAGVCNSGIADCCPQ